MITIRIVYVASLSLLFLVSLALNLESLKGIHHVIVYLITFMIGLYLSYAFLFNKIIEAGPLTLGKNDDKRLRLFYGLMGFLMLGVTYYGIWIWSNT